MFLLEPRWDLFGIPRSLINKILVQSAPESRRWAGRHSHDRPVGRRGSNLILPLGSRPALFMYLVDDFDLKRPLRSCPQVAHFPTRPQRWTAASHFEHGWLWTSVAWVVVVCCCGPQLLLRRGRKAPAECLLFTGTGICCVRGDFVCDTGLLTLTVRTDLGGYGYIRPIRLLIPVGIAGMTLLLTIIANSVQSPVPGLSYSVPNCARKSVGSHPIARYGRASSSFDLRDQQWRVIYRLWITAHPSIIMSVFPFPSQHVTEITLYFHICFGHQVAE